MASPAPTAVATEACATCGAAIRAAEAEAFVAAAAMCGAATAPALTTIEAAVARCGAAAAAAAATLWYVGCSRSSAAKLLNICLKAAQASRTTEGLPLQASSAAHVARLLYGSAEATVPWGEVGASRERLPDGETEVQQHRHTHAHGCLGSCRDASAGRPSCRPFVEHQALRSSSRIEAREPGRDACVPSARRSLLVL